MKRRIVIYVDYCSVLECAEQVPCPFHEEIKELPDWPTSEHTATFRGRRVPVVRKTSKQFTYDPSIPAVLTVNSGSLVLGGDVFFVVT